MTKGEFFLFLSPLLDRYGMQWHNAGLALCLLTYVALMQRCYLYIMSLIKVCLGHFKIMYYFN